MTLDPEPTIIHIRVITRARRDEITGERDGRLVVRTTAPPVDGTANEAVRSIVAAHYGVARSKISIVKGERSRDKTLHIDL